MLYIPGEYICITGVYDVLHSGHRAPRQVWLFANQKFPRCRQCESGVLIKSVGGRTWSQVAVQIRILPIDPPLRQTRFSRSRLTLVCTVGRDDLDA